MRIARAHRLALIWAVIGLVTIAAGRAPVRADDAPNAQLEVPACASEPKRLGLSRIVEIDTKDGPHFGGGRGTEANFLKDHEVILTFDDGPLRVYTKPILKALAAHCTRATFFMVGRMAAADPDMVREIARAGHTIGSHTQTHHNLQATGVLKGRQEVDSGIASITRALGRPPAPFFRFPFLGGNRHVDRYTRSQNLATFWVDVDAKDYLTRDPAVVHARIMAQLREQRKGIILMHDIQPSTARAMTGLLDELRDKGFKVVHVVAKSQGEAIATANPDALPQVADDAVRRAPEAQSAVTTGSTSPVTREPRRSSKVAEKPAAAPSAEEELPWLKPKSAAEAPVPPPPPTPATKPKRQALGKEDTAKSWFANIFSN